MSDSDEMRGPATGGAAATAASDLGLFGPDALASEEAVALAPVLDIVEIRPRDPEAAPPADAVAACRAVFGLTSPEAGDEASDNPVGTLCRLDGMDAALMGTEEALVARAAPADETDAAAAPTASECAKPVEGAARLSLAGVEVRLGGFAAVRAVDLTLEAGEVACLVASAGGGAPVLARALAGRHPISAGAVLIDGAAAPAAAVAMPLEPAALLAHRTVREHVVLGLAPERWAQADLSEAAERWIVALDLEAIADQPVGALAELDKRRAAWARALAAEPAVLVCDLTDLGAADGEAAQAARGVAATGIAAAREAGAAVLVATRDAALARDLGDSVHHMARGEIVDAVGEARDIRRSPGGETAASTNSSP